MLGRGTSAAHRGVMWTLQAQKEAAGLRPEAGVLAGFWHALRFR